MKRCIICGNMGDDNSTVCDVCGNPYLDLEDEVRNEELNLPEEEEFAEAAEADRKVQTADDTWTEEKKEADTDLAEAEAAAAAEPLQAEEAQAERPEERRAARPERRMKSGPQIYGQNEGAGMPGNARRTRAPRRPMTEQDAPVRPMQENTPEGPENAPNGQRRAVNAPNGQGRPVNAPNGQRRAVNAPNGQGRPVNAPNGQGRPVNVPNGQGRPVNAPNGQGRPVNAPNGQGRPMNAPNGQGRPVNVPNGQGRPMNVPNGQGRPMGMPGGPARVTAFQSGKIKAVSRQMFKSPIFILMALLQTVYLVGSVAAIFMKELNFSQGLRLLTSLNLPAQLLGYTDNLLKLTIRLDSDAVIANLIMRIPDLLMCLGLWMLVIAVRTRKEEMSGAGFSFIKVVVIIGMIKNCILMLALLIISVALTVSAWVSGVQGMIVGAVAGLVLMIVVTMMIIMYYFCYLAMLRTFRSNTVEGESYGSASGYVAVISVVIGLSAVIGLLSGIVNAELSGIVNSVGKIGWLILFAVWIMMYRGKMSETEEF